MTHEELLNKIDNWWLENDHDYQLVNAIRAVMKVHKPCCDDLNELHRGYCLFCSKTKLTQYPCVTIQAIKKELM